MLKAGDFAFREDHRVRGSKSGKPEEIGGYHMYGRKYEYHAFKVQQKLK